MGLYVLIFKQGAHGVLKDFETSLNIQKYKYE